MRVVQRCCIEPNPVGSGCQFTRSSYYYDNNVIALAVIYCSSRLMSISEFPFPIVLVPPVSVDQTNYSMVSLVSSASVCHSESEAKIQQVYADTHVAFLSRYVEMFIHYIYIQYITLLCPLCLCVVISTGSQLLCRCSIDLI